ncbi:hypothetical protein ACS0TY_029740 [Phlomoides rotata]
MEIMDREFCKIFWEDDEFDWAYKGSTGMSGGLLCTWRSSCFIMESCLDRTGALEIKGFWGENKVKCSVVNVYMPCIRTRRYEIFDEWNNIYPLYEDYILCFAGDFNTVRTSCERKGRGMATSFQECDKFNDFISTCGLEELSLRGRKYTWYKEDDSAMSRIDRVLINEIGFGIGPVFPSRLSQELCRTTVLSSQGIARSTGVLSLSKSKTVGTAGFIFKEKLKLLKSELRVWDRKNCSTMEHKAEEAKKKISELDMKAEAVDLSAEEIEVRKDCFQTFKDAKLSKNIMLFQQSRDKWIKDGEENSKFFHAIINQRRKINNINGIFMGGSWVEGVEATKVAIKDHFQNAFTEESWSVSPKLNNLEFKQIDSEESNMLTLELWEIIKLTMLQNADARVCVAGDFNSMRSPEERVGKRAVVERRDMEHFGDFISQSNREHFGQSFTWYRPDGTCKSKIDHHVPLVLQSGSKDWGLRPFRFMNSWIEHPQYKAFFLEKWNSYCIEGWAAFRLKEKLKLFKSDLRGWNKVIFGDIDYNIDTKKEEIEILDRIDDGRVVLQRHSRDGLFSTTTAYQKLRQRDEAETEEQKLKSAFDKLWKSYAPRRYQFIVWKELHNRLPTKEKLQRMGVIPSSSKIKCEMCGEESKNSSHLLINCRIVHNIWSKIHEWTGVTMVPHVDTCINLLQHSVIMGHGKKERIASTIWVCTCWVIWNSRNKATFNEEAPNINKMIGEIKARSWNWVISKAKEMCNRNFTDWSSDIRRCCGNI